MRKFRSPDLKRLLVGQHIVNGATVGVGVIAIALAASAILGFTENLPEAIRAFDQGRKMLDYRLKQLSKCVLNVHAGKTCDPVAVMYGLRYCSGVTLKPRLCE